MGERLIRLHQDGGLQYENHLNPGEEVITYTDDDGSIDIYVRGHQDPDVVLTGPMAAELNTVPAPSDEPSFVGTDDEYTDWTVAVLKEELGNRGLPTSGNKAELVKRLEQDDEGA